MRFLKRCAPWLLLAGALWGVMAWPSTTRQGVNFEVTERRIPLIIKGMNFLARDYEYRRLAAEVTRGRSTDALKADALFRWTREHIRLTPPGWPVVDDHITHIIIRGYGGPDQIADVFSVLTTYAGIPSFWRVVRVPEARHVVLCFVKIQGRWTVWDVTGGGAFRDAENRLIAVERLAENPSWSPLAGFKVPETLRAQKQMPGPRLWFEIRRAIIKKCAVLTALWRGESTAPFES